MEDEDDLLLQHYLEIGAIEIAGMMEDGELMFEIKEEAKDIAPELWQSHINYVNDAMMDLYKKDLIDVEYDENLEPTFKIPPETMEIIRKKGLFPMEEE